MTPTTLAATILRDVPRYGTKSIGTRTFVGQDDQGEMARFADVIAALTAALDPALSERAGEVLEGVTPEPWTLCRLADQTPYSIQASYGCVNGLSALFTLAHINVPDEAEVGMTDGAFDRETADANARFIAWCRNNVPALLAQNAALRAERDELREELLDLNRKSLSKQASLQRALTARVGVPTDCRKWDCYPIEMPLTKDGHGPAIPGRDEIACITYEVWDRTLESHASFDNLPDAINEAMRLSLAAPALTTALDPADAPLIATRPLTDEEAAAIRAEVPGRCYPATTDASTQKGGDAHAVDPRHAPHEASPGVTAGADAAQARECAECGERDPRWQSACPLSYCPHVNDTPKSEHDAGNVLTPAQAREAALEKEVLRLKARLWAIGHAAGCETKEDLMKDACDAIGEARK